MKQSLVLSILLLLSSSFAPIYARNKPNPAKAPVATPAPAPSNSDCSSIIYGMMDCLSYLTIPSNETVPSKVCCDSIETVLEYNPKCVCVGLESSKDLGLSLNNTRALAMPTTCKLPIAVPHCGVKLPGASPPDASTPPASPSAGTPTISPSSSTKSPTTSPSVSESPAITAPSPSISGTDKLSVPTMALFAVMVTSYVYISAFFN